MKQEFSVNTSHDQASKVVEVVVRCSANLIHEGLRIAAMQVEGISPEGAIAPPLAPAPTVPNRSQLDAFIDAEWQERSRGPVLPNTGRF